MTTQFNLFHSLYDGAKPYLITPGVLCVAMLISF